MTIELPTEEETRRLGQALGEATLTGGVIGLIGEVASGKTTLAQAVLAAWRVASPVASPTYTLIHTYPGRIYHVDLYRLHAAEVAGLGLEELFEPGARAVVEWADRAGDILPADRLQVHLSHRQAGRHAAVRAGGQLSGEALGRLRTAWQR